MKRAVALVALCSCGLFPSLDGLSGGDASSAIDAAAEIGADVTTTIDAAPDVIEASTDAPPACDATACGASCVNLQTDSKNCGACGHDCLGAGCFGGQCVPTELIKGESGPYDLAAENGQIYWTAQGTGQVATCNVSNCVATRTTLAALGTPQDLTIDATNVYWTDTGGARVLECARAGCGQAPTTLASSQTGLDGITASNGVVYWSTSTAIVQCAAAGCGGAPTTFLAAYADDLAVNGGSFFAAGGSHVYTCKLPSCTSLVTIPSSGAESVASDGKSIFFTAAGVFDCPITGCTAAATFSPGGAPNDIVTDGTNVYWVDDTFGEALACPTTGCGTGARVLATGLSTPKGVAVDAQRVYFSDTGGGRILWVAK